MSSKIISLACIKSYHHFCCVHHFIIWDSHWLCLIDEAALKCVTSLKMSSYRKSCSHLNCSFSSLNLSSWFYFSGFIYSLYVCWSWLFHSPQWCGHPSGYGRCDLQLSRDHSSKHANAGSGQQLAVDTATEEKQGGANRVIPEELSFRIETMQWGRHFE